MPRVSNDCNLPGIPKLSLTVAKIDHAGNPSISRESTRRGSDDKTTQTLNLRNMRGNRSFRLQKLRNILEKRKGPIDSADENQAIKGKKLGSNIEQNT